MAELMQEHDAEERHVLNDVPRHRLVFINPVHDLEIGNQEPAPVQKDLDAGDTKQRQRTGREFVHR
jgi:hypothetical protein